MREPADLTAEFRALGLKVTPQRQLLFRLLHGNSGHPSAEALFALASEHMPGISVRTVYQTLNDLVAMGELQTVNVGSGSTRFDPNNDHHHHAQCATCGDIRDVYVDGVHDLGIDGLDDFNAHRTHILFTGTCAPCATALV